MKAGGLGRLETKWAKKKTFELNGLIAGVWQVGIFPANFVIDSAEEEINHVDSIFADVNLVKIDFKELKLDEVIGVGGFCKVRFLH